MSLITRSGMSLGLIVLLGTIPVASVSASELQGSTWSTQYRAPSGQVVSAVVQFNGAEGSYDVLDAFGNCLATGQLYDIRYFEGQNNFFIEGHWALNGVMGSFRFQNRPGDLDTFSGSWSDSQRRSGFWNGRRD